LLTLTIEIAEGRTDTILIHEGDDPTILAEQFIATHGLDQDLLQILSHQIRENMEEVMQKHQSMDNLLDRIDESENLDTQNQAALPCQ
jgi:uncharacterized coiled-coil protein SlyX